MMYEWMSGSFMRLILSAPIRLLLMSVLGKGACVCVRACVRVCASPIHGMVTVE